MNEIIQNDTDMLMKAVRGQILDIQDNIARGAQVSINDIEIMRDNLSRIYDMARAQKLEVVW